MKSKHIRKVLLLVAITILLIGLASAATTNKTNTNKDTKVIKDNTKNIKSTPATTKKASTKAVTNNKTQKNNKVKEKTSEKTTQKIEKNKQKNTKTETETVNVGDWVTLNNTIEQVTGDTTIKLENDLDVTTEKITLNKQGITVTIDGNGQTINGKQKQVFLIEQGSTLHLKNVTIKNAQSNYEGGAIYNNGNLNINNVTLTNNTATTTRIVVNLGGGAIKNIGNLNITNSTITNNKGTGYAIHGGAINNYNGNLNITNSTITNNKAGIGGAIYNSHGTLTIQDTTITNNKATTGTNAYAYGGAINNNWGTLTITNSTLNNNQATTTGENAYAYGGAIAIMFDSNNLIITHSTITNNKATSGGTIYIEQSTNYDITDTTFYNNTPANFNINSENKIQLANDDYYISIGEYTIMADGENITSGNGKTELESVEMPSGDYVEIILNGTDERTLNNHFVLRSNIADVYNYTELVEAIETIKTEKYNTYIINLHPGNYNATTSINWEESATKNLIINGNNITLDGNHEYQFIHIGEGLNLTLNNLTITNYKVTAATKGYNPEASTYGGAISNSGNLTIIDSTLYNNQANTIAAFTFSTAYAYGGAIYNNNGNLTITNTTLNNNTARATNSSVSTGCTLYAYGGAIYNNNGNLTLSNATLQDNQATATGHSDNLYSYGGAIYNYYGTLTITHTTLNNNTANATGYNTYGGAIYNDVGTVNITHSTLENNQATAPMYSASAYGGAIYNKHGNITINNVTLTNNQVNAAEYYANAYGGAIHNDGGTVNITDSTFQDNTATATGGSSDSYAVGGAIYNNGNLTLNNVTLTNNQVNATSQYSTAYAHGGAIYNNNGNLTITNNTLTNNTVNATSQYSTAYAHGGAIYVQGPDDAQLVCEIIENHFEGNRATEETIYFQGTVTKTLKDNTYKNTTIGYTDFILNINSTKTEFLSNESLPLKYNASLVHPDWYDEDILDRLSYEINIIDKDKINVTGILANIDLKNYKGVYTANVYNDIFETSNPVEFIVTMPTSINMKVTNNTMGNVIINVDVKDINNEYVTSGVLKVYNNEEEIASIQLKGKSENITLDLDKGEYTLKLEYKANSNDYYLNSTLTDEVTIVSTTSITLTTKNVYIGDSIVFNGTLKDAKGRGLNTNITVTINNKKETVTVTDGKFQIKYTATKKGTVQIIAAFPGDKYNLQSNTTGTFNIQKIDTQLTLAKVKNIYVGDKFTLNITLTDKKGNKLTNKTVQVQINKESTTFNTDKNGNIIYTENWKDNGTFKITISFNGDNQYNPADNVTQTFKVEKIKTTLKVKNQKIQNKDKVKLTATITDQNNKKVNTGKVIFKINGITIKDKNGKAITAKVSKGQATLTFTPNKNYYNKVSNITAVYSENNKYQKSQSKEAKLTLKPRDAKIKLQTTKLKATQYDTIKIKTISKDKNKAIKEGYVIFKINGKTLTKNGKTIKSKIKNGKATLKYNLNGHKTGKYTLTAVLSSTPYKKVTSKTTLKITEDKIHIQAKPVKTSKNKTRIKAKILDAKNKYIKSTIKVSFKINQKTVAKQIKVKNGKINVKIPTKVTKGKHTLNIVAGPNYRYKVARKNVSLIKT